uniref:Uncharacterized protein n=1 Tax=Arundo donax TaxID=35708 RepID=A0A0A9V710_ARUDO
MAACGRGGGAPPGRTRRLVSLRPSSTARAKPSSMAGTGRGGAGRSGAWRRGRGVGMVWGWVISGRRAESQVGFWRGLRDDELWEEDETRRGQRGGVGCCCAATTGR